MYTYVLFKQNSLILALMTAKLRQDKKNQPTTAKQQRSLMEQEFKTYYFYYLKESPILGTIWVLFLSQM